MEPDRARGLEMGKDLKMAKDLETGKKLNSALQPLILLQPLGLRLQESPLIQVIQGWVIQDLGQDPRLPPR